MPTKFKFFPLIRIQISEQANILVDFVICVKVKKGKGGGRYLQIISQKKLKKQITEFLNG